MNSAALMLVVALNLSAIKNDLILPPYIHWQGKSETLIADKENPWVTPIEQSDFTTTPSYADTLSWLEKLCDNSAFLTLKPFGQSPQNRTLYAVIASSAKKTSTRKKPVVLVQAGIHPGEIDGKDAGLMLLRDIAYAGKHTLLKDIDLVFVPIFSADGHENTGPNQRVNQRGPENQGWRTTSTNINLNRDYAKAESPEMQAMIRLINEYNPILYIDAHVTDGTDYQYDITYGFNEIEPYSPAITRWLQDHYRKEVDQALVKNSHIPGPLIFGVDKRNPEKGIEEWIASPRYSNGYGDARHLATILIENHSLKPYKQRVLGTYILLEQSLKTTVKHLASLKKAIKKDQSRRSKKFVYGSTTPKTPAKEMYFLGMAFNKYPSEISGIDEVRWLGKAIKQKMPVFTPERLGYIARPKAYWIPPEWSNIIAKIKLHGIQTETLNKTKTVELSFYRLPKAKIAEKPFEGRVRVSPGKPEVEKHKVTLQEGTVRVVTDQNLGTLAMTLLEPEAEDSLLQWGYFLSIMQSTEYMEGYVVAPMAEKMLQLNPSLRKAFDKKLREDEAFASDPNARLRWFYQQSPYFDSNYLLYPIGFESH